MSEGHVTSPKASFVVFVVLMVLLGVTVWAANIQHAVLGVVIALIIATIKAVLIVLYFMNVRYADQVTRLAVLAGFLGLLLLFVLISTDYLNRDTRRPRGQAPLTAGASHGVDSGGVKVSDAR
jgi:cytochrome c oxidase subunit 4